MSHSQRGTTSSPLGRLPWFGWAAIAGLLLCIAGVVQGASPAYLLLPLIVLAASIASARNSSD
ncbi:hypothetical protein SAMN04489747_0945 [Auraticoccus monumenti]|uniref:Uncharacterized protein n=1 Tax=Auraticoccus monumenti TaxID=675864 RepID=A0A1G6UQT2_9ACTN|nr:hypothetical protein SAMN04489747_0945 [Auraticoccus monumenti]